MAQKTDGNWDDVVRIVGNLRDGMPWHIAIHHKAFMAIEGDWHERNKSRFEEWAKNGLPAQGGEGYSFSATHQATPMQTVVVDGKVMGIFRDAQGRLYKEEIGAPKPLDVNAPLAAETLDQGKLASAGKPPEIPNVVTSEAPAGKAKNKSW